MIEAGRAMHAEFRTIALRGTNVMTSLRPALAVIVLVMSLVIQPQLAVALPIAHEHCAKKPWTLIGTSGTDPEVPVTIGQGGVFKIDFDISGIRPPASGIANCNYEISDLTKLKLTFSYEGRQAAVWREGFLSGPFFPGTFSPGSLFAGGNTFQFPEHPAAGAREGTLPDSLLTVTLRDNTTDISILNVTGELGGNHYYIIPEPSTLTLFGLSALGLLGYARRRRKSGA